MINNHYFCVYLPYLLGEVVASREVVSVKPRVLLGPFNDYMSMCRTKQNVLTNKLWKLVRFEQDGVTDWLFYSIAVSFYSIAVSQSMITEQNKTCTIFGSSLLIHSLQMYICIIISNILHVHLFIYLYSHSFNSIECQEQQWDHSGMRQRGQSQSVQNQASPPPGRKNWSWDPQDD